MPTYGYECKDCKEQFETFQSITADPLKIHDGCGGELRRLIYPVGIAFKGPGFYVNDYANSGKKETPANKTGANAENGTGSESKTETKTESKPKAAAAAAPAATPVSSGSSS
jgi:putative FmdB family regulatory protein